MNSLVIIGGSDAGIMAALRAKEVDPSMKVTVVTADAYPNYSICGLPFWLGAEVSGWKNLAHRTREDIEKKDIEVLIDHRTVELQPEQHTVTIEGEKHHQKKRTYDKLILATGAVSLKPSIQGLHFPGVFFLRWMTDGLALEKYLEMQKPKSIALIGGGYIGMEMAEAMSRRGLEVKLIEHASSLMPNIDPEISLKVEASLKSRGIDIHTGFTVKEISRAGSRLRVIAAQAGTVAADFVIVAAGVRPNTELAVSAGIETGIKDAIKVTRRMETNRPGIFAAGDCVETWHRVLNRPAYLPLGSVAHKQGWVAGENAAGGERDYPGSLGTQAVKIFDQVVARTGLLAGEARAAGFEAAAVSLETWDHKVYYPNARTLTIRITGDLKSRKLLGAQILGSIQSEVSKRIDILATALYHGMSVDELEDLDLSYTPPLSSPWDPVQMAARVWTETFTL